MPRSTSTLCADAERIWRAGVAAVLPERLVQSHVHRDGDVLLIDDEAIDLRGVRRIAIVGAGKAAGAMAAALETVLGPQLLATKYIVGWINVPADCIVPTRRVHLHASRPAGVNEPRVEGVEGARRILEIVSSLEPDDLCICLFTGGGSALLPAPAPGISLDDKIRVTRLLSAAGANIGQLNVVRAQLSMVKGGGLARACRAGRLVTLLISDVLGDPLDVIASGPTVQSAGTPAGAIGVLEDLGLVNEPTLQPVVQWLHGGGPSAASAEPLRPEHDAPIVTHHVLGNNATAVDGAGAEAERLGYSHAMVCANKAEGPAEEVGRHIAKMALRMRVEPGPDCLISGGEPTVRLTDESRRGKGGRNQQLALAALTQLGDCAGIALLAAGTDGEDGPTDAAGAFVTEAVVRAAREQKLDAHDFLRRNDAYSFFQRTSGLFITGPTQTNVCDLRVVLVERDQSHHH
jgi:hydroxypyruvate reductase